MGRTRVYVDGFSFYYAVKDAAKSGAFPIGLGWCDFRKLAETTCSARMIPWM